MLDIKANDLKHYIILTLVLHKYLCMHMLYLILTGLVAMSKLRYVDIIIN